MIEEHGFQPKKLEVWLGLAEPDHLELVVIFNGDSEAEKAMHELSGKLKDAFRKHLADSWYPTRFASMAGFSIHSHENIMRNGGYYTYFK
jgi:hypothetical protein